ncbi:MAG: HAMP domain-containing histidine kinase [Planctomycetes bacterium]|nr:HAMP domain-containing histidine kinase [Planctomycetota bacterium]
MLRFSYWHLPIILLPAGALAFYAFRAARLDYEEQARFQQARIESAAEILKLRIEGSIQGQASAAEEAFQWAQRTLRSGESKEFHEGVAFARGEKLLGFHPLAAREEPFHEALSAKELRFYKLALKGGESYELDFKDPARALDAYAFYLPRLKSPLLKARLRFRIARAALAAGEEALARAVFEDLSREEPPASTEEGLPIDLLALERLLELCGEPKKTLKDLEGRIEERTRRFTAPLLAHWITAYFPESERLKAILARRRALEAALARHPQVLSSQEAALEEGYLLLARSLTPAPSAANPEPPRAIWGAALEPLPELPGTLPWRLEYGPSTPPGTPLAAKPGTAARAIQLSKSGPALAVLRVSDSGFQEALSRLGFSRLMKEINVGLLLLVISIWGVVMARGVARERNLARLRARLLANVSHELKTPITSIRMFSEMLAKDPLDEQRVRRFGELLLSESLRLSRLIENLLDFSRLHREDIALPREPVDFGALLRKAAEGFSYRAREKGADFQAGGCDQLEITLNTNAGAIERILSNLLDNALKYNQSEKPVIRLSAGQDGSRVRIDVADNGIGIPYRDQERVFEEFYRVRYDDYAVQGTGLGLAIARRLARQLGGDIQLQSREKEGSKFTLILPMKDKIHHEEHEGHEEGK